MTRLTKLAWITSPLFVSLLMKHFDAPWWAIIAFFAVDMDIALLVLIFARLQIFVVSHLKNES
jgi:hypothetical protein